MLITMLIAKISLLWCVPGGLKLLAHRVSADLRSRMLVACAACVPLLTILHIGGPEIPLWTESATSVAVVSVNSGAPRANVVQPMVVEGIVEPISIVNWCLVIWVLGSLLLLLGGFWWRLQTMQKARALPSLSGDALRRLLSDAPPELKKSGVLVKSHSELKLSPFVCGIKPPLLVVPADFDQWPDGLRHEPGHFDSRHYLGLIIMHVLAALVWWHPLMWWLVREYRREIEQVCDDRVLAENSCPHTYARQLLQVAARGTVAGSLAMSGRVALERRIRAIVNREQRRSGASSFVCVGTCCLLVGLTLLAGTGQVAQAQAEQRRYTPVVKVMPIYPEHAQAAGVEGYVVLEFDVNPQGKTENVSVYEQHPANGTFEHAAREALAKFYYLPQRQNGENIAVRGVRNRITFTLGRGDDRAGTGGMQLFPDDSDAESRLGELQQIAKQRAKTRLVMQRELAEHIAYGEAGEDGDRFLQLALYAMSDDPGLTEYFLLRASQRGTSDPTLQKYVGGMVLFHRGALEQALALLQQVPVDHASFGGKASRWISFIEAERARQSVVREALMALN